MFSKCGDLLLELQYFTSLWFTLYCYKAGMFIDGHKHACTSTRVSSSSVSPVTRDWWLIPMGRPTINWCSGVACESRHQYLEWHAVVASSAHVSTAQGFVWLQLLSMEFIQGHKLCQSQFVFQLLLGQVVGGLFFSHLKSDLECFSFQQGQ